MPVKNHIRICLVNERETVLTAGFIFNLLLVLLVIYLFYLLI